MKCPECSYNQRKKYGTVCRCGYKFTFHPQNDGITDGKFIAIENAASQNGTFYYTLNQLYATFCRRTRTKVSGPIGCTVLSAIIISLVIAGFAGLLPWFDKGLAIFATVVAVVLVAAPWSAYLKDRPRPLADFAKLVERWKSQSKDLPFLIEKPSLHQPPPNWTEEDIYDYGAERLLIVERDILVDWLVLNGFHTSERALIISERGYPDYLIPRMEQILETQPDVPIYLLHDASTIGASMKNRIEYRYPRHKVIDLGIQPEDVPRIKKLRGVEPSRPGAGIPVDAVPYMTLTGGLAIAMADQITLAELLSRPVPDEGASGSFG